MVKHIPTYATIATLFLVAGCSSGSDGQPLIDEDSEETLPSIGESPDESSLFHHACEKQCNGCIKYRAKTNSLLIQKQDERPLLTAIWN